MNELDYYRIIKMDRLLTAWVEFRRGKRKRTDVQIFERKLEDNLFKLHQDLQNKTYSHGTYQSFYVNDPKRRHIHKAPVRDRVVHHLLYLYLYQVFDKSFIFDSYSCRTHKGTHKGVIRVKILSRIVSQNYKKPCWGLKCDIKKFFASIDHKLMLQILTNKIQDGNIIWLLRLVINSFQTDGEEGKGIPLGNLTSQIFANIYLNELDQFIKHKLKIRHYLRYADDFLLISEAKEELEACIDPIRLFLKENLKLELHPAKIIYRKLSWGIDFLGYVTLPRFRLLRTKTKRRMFKKIASKIQLYKNGVITFEQLHQTIQSYLGYLIHANSFTLSQKLRNQIWFWLGS